MSFGARRIAIHFKSEQRTYGRERPAASQAVNPSRIIEPTSCIDVYPLATRKKCEVLVHERIAASRNTYSESQIQESIPKLHGWFVVTAKNFYTVDGMERHIGD